MKISEDTMTTPMLEQYFALKKQHQDEILLFRLGDFYEMFDNDAVAASKVLDIALTRRYRNTAHEIPMCGVPYHAVEQYIAKLTKAGLRVAVCDQLSDPSLPGIVERQVTRIVTPGTTLNETTLHEKENNYLVAIEMAPTRTATTPKFGVSFVDLSTGECAVTEIEGYNDLVSELKRLAPSEVIFARELMEDAMMSSILSSYHHRVYEIPVWQKPTEVLKEHFHAINLEMLGRKQSPLLAHAGARILLYLKDMQKQTLQHVKKITFYRVDDSLILDEVTIRNLDIFKNSFNGTKEHTLISVLDRTQTAHGGRLLRQWILRPLQKKEHIEQRLFAVEEFLKDKQKRTGIREILKNIGDMERILARICMKRGNARDLIHLKTSLQSIPKLREALSLCQFARLRDLSSALSEHPMLVDLIEKAIVDDPPMLLTEGGIIRAGFHGELDRLRDIVSSGKGWMYRLQEKERVRTGISSLKIGYNRVFGYYIEISKSNLHLVPSDYIRKQTLANAERFVTQELKEYEEKVLYAEEDIKALEERLFFEVAEQAVENAESLQHVSRALATLDVLTSLAQVSFERHYCRPEISEDGVIHIIQGRHPVIEAINEAPYIPNNLHLHSEQQLIILTGPNMSGKSSYIRQAAIIVLLAHVGSFVPAESARIGIVDRIFTRVGASDNLTQGQSTFMVEMQEAAHIIRHATKKSLVVFDELGRGTSTYDGVSLAWAIAKYVHDTIQAKTLFATHYHELIELERILPHAKNYSVQVKEGMDGNVVFLHTVVEGGVSKSYGIEVARLAGLPQEIIMEARNVLHRLSSERDREEELSPPLKGIVG